MGGPAGHPPPDKGGSAQEGTGGLHEKMGLALLCPPTAVPPAAGRANPHVRSSPGRGLGRGQRARGTALEPGREPTLGTLMLVNAGQSLGGS